MDAPQPQADVVFLVEESPGGGFMAAAVGVSIFTQADTLDGLRANVREAVACHYEPGQRPHSIRLRIVREEVLRLDARAPRSSDQRHPKSRIVLGYWMGWLCGE
jgi:hypothetical protein